jgi:hypothetical protein
VEHPRLTFEDVRIERIVVPSLLQAPNKVEDSKDDSGKAQNTGSNSANNGSSRDSRAG